MSEQIKLLGAVLQAENGNVLFPCAGCGEDCSDGFHQTLDGDFCDACFKKHYKICTDCGKVIKKKDGKYNRDNRKWFCVDCHNAKLTFCSNCNKEIQKTTTKVVSGDQLCKECFDAEFVVCKDCGAVIKKSDAEIDDGNNYCKECFDARYTECIECSIKIRENTAVYVLGKAYCNSCATTQLVTCDHCGTQVPINESHEDEYVHLCHDCYVNHYYTCDSCRNFVLQSDCVSRNNNIYCPDCAPTRAIHDYSFKPTPRFYGGNEFSCFMGIELEVDSGGERDENAIKVQQVINKDRQYVYMKHDGSISNGFEIVTYPMTLDWHMNRVPWKETLKKLQEMRYRSHDAGSCGLHIHLSRKAFGNNIEEQDMNTMKLLFFFEKFWDKMVRFARRTDAQVSRWAKRYGMKRTPQELLSTAKCSERYFAVNLRNEKTIELRIFRGTLNYNSFISTLQFAHELIRILTQISIQEVVALKWDDFISKIDSQYTDLTSYLQRRGLATEASFKTVHVDDTADDLIAVG